MAGGDYIAFLEDDDLWSPDFLAVALNTLQQFDFVSSTQIDMSVDGQVQRISDFPTPSGWVMKRRTLETVGVFDEAYRWHLDSEWLGRLGDSGLILNLMRLAMSSRMEFLDPSTSIRLFL